MSAAGEENLLLQFLNPRDRSAFLERLSSEAPEVMSAVKPSFSQPNVVIVRGADESQERILRSIGGRFQSFEVFSDVQFRAFGAAE